MDILQKLKDERDREVKIREDAFQREDWVQVNKSQPYIDLLYGAISEIEKSRDRIAAFTEILHKRIVIAHREPG
jgi:SepF-like predicted cell division protein (DUF552 family)